MYNQIGGFIVCCFCFFVLCVLLFLVFVLFLWVVWELSVVFLVRYMFITTNAIQNYQLCYPKPI